MGLTLPLLVAFSCLCLNNGARILGIIPMPSYSHQIVYQPLWRELSLRGHQVTVLTTNPMNDSKLTNLTEIDLSFSYEIMDSRLIEIINNQENSFKMIKLMIDGLNVLVDQQLAHPKVKALIQDRSARFDLLLVETVHPIMIAFSKRFNCPYIGVMSLDAPEMYHQLIGNPSHPVLNTERHLGMMGKLSFKERIVSVIWHFGFNIIRRWLSGPINAMVQKHFGNDYPPLIKIQKNISMIFTNTDFIFHPIRDLLPSIIQIGGGTHRSQSKPLPEDLKQHLDSASQGFIYFSLGSSVKCKDINEATRSIILETFAELPYRVLWKFELEELPGKPDNVLISKWFPQQDVFKHQKIKLFITQGGLQSIDEAIYDYVPMIAIPYFMDQPTNAKFIVHNGIGLSLDYKTLNKDIFKKTILEVINNPKYRNRLKELVNLVKDDSMDGLKKAVWWTEYVLRHKGARHFRSPLLDIPAYQYFYLDIIGSCMAVIIVTILLVIVFIELIQNMLKTRKRKTA